LCSGDSDDDADDDDDDDYNGSQAAENDDNQADKAFVAKSGKVWSKHPPTPRKSRPSNVVRRIAGSIKPDTALKVCTEVDAFKLFLTPAIIQTVVKHTNAEGSRVVSEWLEKNPNSSRVFTSFDDDEVYAFIGLNIIRGVYHLQRSEIRELWSDSDLTMPIFRGTMSLNRFMELKRFMRFDDRNDREERKKSDNFAPIREIFTVFDQQLREHYEPSAFLTIDEQLLNFRGNCRFRVFLKDKPGKYGILIRMLADAQVPYCLGLLPYSGKINDHVKTTTSDMVNSLVKPYFKTGRNVTMDRFFTSVEIAENLEKNGLTIVGTIQHNRKGMPGFCKPDRSREVHSSTFGFAPPCTLVSYTPAKNRAVSVLSTMHSDDKVCPEGQRKPEIVLFYNETKAGVDTIDQMCRYYSSKVCTRRWPYAVFFGLTDIAALNAFVLWSYVKENGPSRRHGARKNFLRNLGRSLCIPAAQKRRTTCLPTNIRAANATITEQNRSASAIPVQLKAPERGRCHQCMMQLSGDGYKAKRQKINSHVQTCCANCSRRVCSKHSERKVICYECAAESQ
jgi:hypothetical protein